VTRTLRAIRFPVYTGALQTAALRGVTIPFHKIPRKIDRQQMDEHPDGTLSLLECGGLWNNWARSGEISRAAWRFCD
jgi:hypothetical protein